MYNNGLTGQFSGVNPGPPKWSSESCCSFLQARYICRLSKQHQHQSTERHEIFGQVRRGPKTNWLNFVAIRSRNFLKKRHSRSCSVGFICQVAEISAVRAFLVNFPFGYMVPWCLASVNPRGVCVCDESRLTEVKVSVEVRCSSLPSRPVIPNTLSYVDFLSSTYSEVCAVHSMILIW